jgi:hypothetical protein
MGHVKEPKGVDFIIESEPLTNKDRQEITKFIANYKAKYHKKGSIRKKTKQPA